MKKILKYLIIGLLLPLNVFAAGSYSVTSKVNITTGKTGNLVIKATNCAGKFTITSSDSSIASISTSEIWLDNSSETIVVTGKKAGTATISVTATDVSDYDENTVSGTKKSTIVVANATTKKTTTTAKKTTTAKTNATTKSTTKATSKKTTTEKKQVYTTVETQAPTTTKKITTNSPDRDKTVTTNQFTTTTSSSTTSNIYEQTTENNLTTVYPNGQSYYITSIIEKNGTSQVVYPSPDDEKRSSVIYDNGTSKIVNFDGYDVMGNYYYTTHPYTSNNTSKVQIRIDNVLIDGYTVTYKNGVYYCTVDEDTEKVTIEAEYDKTLLNVSGDGVRTLAPGINKVVLTVSNKKGESDETYVVIIRPNGDNSYFAKLADLKVIGQELSPKFDPDTMEYTINVSNDTEEVYIEAIASHPDAEVSGTGINYIVNEVTDLLVTVASDEYGSNTYTIHVKKKGNNLLLFIIIGIISASIIGIGAYVLIKRKNWIAKTDEEKEKILSNESVQVSVNGDIEINGEERQIGERIVKPTMVNTMEQVNETEPKINRIVTPTPVENKVVDTKIITKVVTPTQNKIVTTPVNKVEVPVENTVHVVKVANARPVETVMIHSDVKPTIVKTQTINTVAPQVKVVKTVPTNTSINENVNTSVNFNEN